MKLLQSCACRRSFNRRLFGGLLLAPAAALSARSAAAQHKPDAATPGGPPDARSKILNAGANVLQDRDPVDAMTAYLNGFHFYADDMGRQVEAHHYCTHLTEDFHQCVIFDSAGKDAKLIGVEYIVSERVFKSLPDDEKRLWHSHHYEVKSGELIAPGVPDIAEHALMKDLVSTYGKTWHTWQIDRDKNLPLGIPQLMMGFTADGQADADMVGDRDRRLDVSTADQKKNRADIAMPEPDPKSNAWQSGKVAQLTLAEVQVRNPRK
jgi:hypothetical protein